MSDHDPECTLPEQEKCTDPSDRATQTEMEANADALRAVRRNSQRQQEPDKFGFYPNPDCDECGEPIGAKRLAVAIKNRLCIHCCTAMEKRQYFNKGN